MVNLNIKRSRARSSLRVQVHENKSHFKEPLSLNLPFHVVQVKSHPFAEGGFLPLVIVPSRRLRKRNKSAVKKPIIPGLYDVLHKVGYTCCTRKMYFEV